jgi:hypothetical protein
MIFLHIPSILTHTGATYIYKHIYTYWQYLHIQAIPTHTDIPTHTLNTYTYMQYLHILLCLLIPVIPTTHEETRAGNPDPSDRPSSQREDSTSRGTQSRSTLASTSETTLLLQNCACAALSLKRRIMTFCKFLRHLLVYHDHGPKVQGSISRCELHVQEHGTPVVISFHKQHIFCANGVPAHIADVAQHFSPSSCAKHSH